MHRPAARHVLPEFTERTSQGTRTLDPYSKLLAERVVFLGTPVDDTAVSDLVAQLMYLEHDAPDRAISLYINSPGGTFGAMTAVYDTMMFLTCEVETFCLGQAGPTRPCCSRQALRAGGTLCRVPVWSCSSPNSPSRCRDSPPTWRSRHGKWPVCAKR